MRYNQVRDLIVWIAGFHGRMARQFADAANDASDERLSMALQYLADHELRMKSGLEEIFTDGSDHSEVLETWFDDPSDFPQPPMLERLMDESDHDSATAALNTAVTANRMLQDLYRHRALRASIEPEEEFFNSLAEGHEAEIRRMVASMEELEDI